MHIDLDAYRGIGDPAADEALAALADAEVQVEPSTVVAAVGRYLHGPTAPDGEFGRWLLTHVEPPEWADPRLVREGQDVFRRWGLQIGAVLFTASLPWAYAAANGVQVLSRISDLAGRDVQRRVAETGQLLIDVCGLERHGGFAVEGQAYQSLRGVRAVHAACRHALLKSPDWEPAWGVPINQEDLAGTLLTFTVVVFDGLERLGVALRPAEKEAYLHLWAVIGHFLGLDHALIPPDVASASELRHTIAARQHAPSAEGRRLTAALVAELELAMPWGFRKVPRTFVHRVSGPEVANLLDVPSPAWWASALGPVAALGRAACRIAPLRALAGWPGRIVATAMFRLYIDSGLDGQRPRFRIDADDAVRWRLGLGPRRRARRRRRTARRTARSQ